MDIRLELIFVAKLFIALLLGALVGTERERHGNAAGIRTYAAVSLGAALFTLIGIHSTDETAASAWLFVPSCNFLTGTVRYFTGTASLQGVGGPQTFHGIDRETRVVSTSSGCIFVGFEPFVFPANNAAVRLWTNLFGFQRGSYKGAFPTEEEAQEIIKSADTIIVNHTDNFLQFSTAGQTVKVDTSDFYSYRSSSSAFDKVVGKIIKNECFIFQRLDNKDEEEKKAIYIVDISKNKLLKTYFDYY